MFYILTIIAGAIFCDIVLNDGDATANILNAIASIFHRKPMKIDEIVFKSEQAEILEYIESIKEEIDELNNELTYDNSPQEIDFIKKKLAIRQQLLEAYLYRLNQHKQSDKQIL